MVYLASNHQGMDLERHEIKQLMAGYGMVDVGLVCRDDASPYNWELVRELIKSCDLFILILGENYGPRLPTGISYLHREFMYAVSCNKPVISFIKNCLPSQGLTDEQSRLDSFHKVIKQQSAFKLWHLRDELISQARISFSSGLLSMGNGWISADSPQETKEATKPNDKSVAKQLTARQKLASSQQMVNLSVSANVYRDGNLSVHNIFIPMRLDRIHKALSNKMKDGCSEDSLRKSLGNALSKITTEQLLAKNPKAHAVDDVRVSREQFQKILVSWEELGLVACKKSGNRSVYYTGEPA